MKDTLIKIITTKEQLEEFEKAYIKNSLYSDAWKIYKYSDNLVYLIHENPEFPYCEVAIKKDLVNIPDPDPINLIA